ncbi:AMP-binding protein [Shimazuella sp. AN120528]|uniref:AMP-binding protein n=1 Tax=Shimazuella soli TaxID=1892854 RepID=UPI001F10B337|nr:AMP-binding protein [Shimazuella soli]MCH5584502.1 AMP-binding protein [Shimazuella soli]
MTVSKPWLHQYPPQIPKTLSYPDVALTALLTDAVKQYPDREAIHFLGKKISYRTLLDETYRFAEALKEAGVKADDRVAIMLPNIPQAVISYYASLFLDGVVVQVNPMYTERELLHILNDSGATSLICLDIHFDRVEKVHLQTNLQRIIVTSVAEYLPLRKKLLYPLTQKSLPKIPREDHVYLFQNLLHHVPFANAIQTSKQADDLALLQYTGGTTGLAKGSMLSHRNLVANAHQASAWMYKTREGQEKILGVLPFFHVYGMTAVMNLAIKLAATMILLPKFDRDQILKTIAKEKPTIFPGAPTMYVSLINHPQIHKYQLNSIDACISGSAPLPIEVQDKFEQLTGGRLVEGYGLTETSPVTHTNLIWDRKKSSTIGLPWPDTECRIVSMETGEELAPGLIGELQIRGPQVMKGYWNRPEETAQVIKDGWLSTGDMAKMDEEGYFYIVDRRKDLIIAGGFNIYPREVEEVLYEHPAVDEAVVIGVPDAYRGETTKAYIVIKKGMTVTSSELDKHCRANLASFKVPRLYEFRDELPKSSIGKILRRVLQDEIRAEKKN